jgi:hypothetical protein
MNYTDNDLPAPQSKTITHKIVLEKIDTAWKPGTTKSVWYGPGTITYTIHPDGEINSTKE